MANPAVTIFGLADKSCLNIWSFIRSIRSQEIDGDDVDVTIKTNGLDFSVFLDNRDFWLNPSRGYGLRGKKIAGFRLE